MVLFFSSIDLCYPSKVVAIADAEERFHPFAAGVALAIVNGFHLVVAGDALAIVDGFHPAGVRGLFLPLLLGKNISIQQDLQELLPLLLSIQ